MLNTKYKKTLKKKKILKNANLSVCYRHQLLFLFELGEDCLCHQHHNNHHHQRCHHHHHLYLIFELVEEWDVVVGGDLLALPVDNDDDDVYDVDE